MASISACASTYGSALRRWAGPALCLLVLAAPLAAAADDWYMAGANPQRTSWVPEEVRGLMRVRWYHPIEPYIPQNVDLVVCDGNIYVSTARGLYCLRSADGALQWVYPTEMPLGHSPTVVDGVAYVGGFDRKLHAVDAATGKRLWTWQDAQAGFHTSPLVINGKVILGNRDGNLYAIGAHGTASQGQTLWTYATGGPINFSCAYDDGKVYFASQDLHAYAVDSETGQLVWKSAKFNYAAGFNSWWPVVWRDKVVFVTHLANYRQNERPGVKSVLPYNAYGTYNSLENAHMLAPLGGSNGYIGQTGTEPGDGSWAPNTMTMDADVILTYHQAYPWRKMQFVLQADTGQEYSFLYNGQPAYWPANNSNTTRNGSRTPPTIGTDDVIYIPIMHRYQNYARGQACGWVPGVPYISIPYPNKHNANDEPLRLSGGGDVIYWTLCCDREMGAFSRIPGDGGWQHVSYNLGAQAPGYDAMWAYKGGLSGLWGAYGSDAGIYHNHTADQNAIVPYMGRLFYHRSNCVIAWDPSTSPPVSLPLSPTVEITEPPTPLPQPTIQARLEAEIQRMLDAGRLRPGYFQGGQWWDRGAWGEYLNDYFRHPGDTIWAMTRALPHLPPAMQTQVRDYLQDWWNAYPPYTYVGIGWNDGAKREFFDLPPEVQDDCANQGPRTTPRNINIWSWPPHSFYAMWKYAEAGLGDAQTILNAARSKLDRTPPDDTMLQTYRYLNNAFIAGYIGYLNLQTMAGETQDAAIVAELNRLMNMRAATFTKDSPFDWEEGSGNHAKRMNVFNNFKDMVPELADYLRQHALSKVQEALDETDSVAPYWFVTHYEGTLQEGTIQNLHDFNAVFQARAWILRQSQSELQKFLDVPAFPVGDLFYIHQLVSLLEAEAPQTRQVVQRLAFCNHSAADGNDAAANEADDDAVYPGKRPVLPGQASDAAGIIGHLNGLNGLMIDIAAAGDAASIGLDDLALQISPSGQPGSWAPAPAPQSVTVRLGAGLDGSDRVTIIWAGGIIKDCWLRVDVLATADTGLAEPDTFYWGSLRGDIDGDGQVSVLDLLKVQQNYLKAAGDPSRDDAADLTGDGNVNVLDLLAVRMQYLRTLPQLAAP